MSKVLPLLQRKKKSASYMFPSPHLVSRDFRAKTAVGNRKEWRRTRKEKQEERGPLIIASQRHSLPLPPSSSHHLLSTSHHLLSTSHHQLSTSDHELSTSEQELSTSEHEVCSYLHKNSTDEHQHSTDEGDPTESEEEEATESTSDEDNPTLPPLHSVLHPLRSQLIWRSATTSAPMVGIRASLQRGQMHRTLGQSKAKRTLPKEDREFQINQLQRDTVTLLDLPVECLFHIMQFIFPGRYLVAVAGTCKGLRAVITKLLESNYEYPNVMARHFNKTILWVYISHKNFLSEKSLEKVKEITGTVLMQAKKSDGLFSSSWLEKYSGEIKNRKYNGYGILFEKK